MKLTKPLTLKQQAQVRTKVSRILLAAGFTVESEPTGGAWWWRKSGLDSRICVGVGVRQWGTGSVCASWCWQTAPLTKPPMFGMDGTLSTGAQWATVKKILDNTFERFVWAGVCQQAADERVRSAELKKRIAAVITELSVL